MLLTRKLAKQLSAVGKCCNTTYEKKSVYPSNRNSINSCIELPRYTHLDTLGFRLTTRTVNKLKGGVQ